MAYACPAPRWPSRWSCRAPPARWPGSRLTPLGESGAARPHRDIARSPGWLPRAAAVRAPARRVAVTTPALSARPRRATWIAASRGLSRRLDGATITQRQPIICRKGESSRIVGNFGTAARRGFDDYGVGPRLSGGGRWRTPVPYPLLFVNGRDVRRPVRGHTRQRHDLGQGFRESAPGRQELGPPG